MLDLLMLYLQIHSNSTQLLDICYGFLTQSYYFFTKPPTTFHIFLHFFTLITPPPLTFVNISRDVFHGVGSGN